MYTVDSSLHARDLRNKLDDGDDVTRWPCRCPRDPAWPLVKPSRKLDYWPPVHHYAIPAAQYSVRTHTQCTLPSRTRELSGIEIFYLIYIYIAYITTLVNPFISHSLFDPFTRPYYLTLLSKLCTWTSHLPQLLHLVIWLHRLTSLLAPFYDPMYSQYSTQLRPTSPHFLTW